MSSSKLPNYLRLHRKRLGFSAKEIAFLLGVKNGSQVSRYEHFHRVPNLRTALAYQAIFRSSPPELFGGTYERVAKEVQRRAKRLLRRLEGQPLNRLASRKIEWLIGLAGEAQTPNQQ